MKTLQSEIMKALEDAKCLDPESENWSYHTASRIAADVASQFREPSSPTVVHFGNTACAKCGGKGYYFVSDSVTAATPCVCQNVINVTVSPTIKESETAEQEEIWNELNRKFPDQDSIIYELMHNWIITRKPLDR